MKNLLPFLLLCFVILSKQTLLSAQSGNIHISLSGSGTTGTTEAKSIFGMNKVHFVISNTLSREKTNYTIRFIRSEFRYKTSPWMTMPDMASYDVCGGNDNAIRPYDSLQGFLYVPLYNLYLDDTFRMKSFVTTGGTIDYRLIYVVRYGAGTADTFIHSSIIHIRVPAATRQDKAALWYVLQEKSTCGELQYFFADADMITLRCLYIYEYLAKKFPNSLLGKASAYKIASVNCLMNNQDLDALPKMKAAVMKTRDMLLNSGISYLQERARELVCMNK